MHLNISADSSLKSIQQAFNEIYPFLHIEFLQKRPGSKSLVKAEKMPSEILVKSLSDGFTTTRVPILKSTTIAELEERLHQLLGVNIQVFRKAGSVWVETLLTDDWTLEQQNLEGMQLTADKIPGKPSGKKGNDIIN